MWFLSAEKGDLPCSVRIKKIRAVSSNGTIRMVKAITGADLMGIIVLGEVFISQKLMMKMASKYPIKSAPVSPKKTFRRFAQILNKRKAPKDPVIEAQMIAIS